MLAMQKKRGSVMSLDKFLQPVLDRVFELHHYIYKWMMKPFRINLGGKNWLIATDGHSLLMLPDDDKYQFSEEGFERTKNLLTLNSIATYRTKLTQLKELIGEPRWSDPCSDCNGKGTFICEECKEHGLDHTARCLECFGSGEEEPSISKVLIADLAINANRIACALSCIPSIQDEYVVIDIYKPSYGVCFFFTGRDWKILIMALKDDKDASNTPRLELEEFIVTV
jgi:hypothetical protein